MAELNFLNVIEMSYQNKDFPDPLDQVKSLRMKKRGAVEEALRKKIVLLKEEARAKISRLDQEFDTGKKVIDSIRSSQEDKPPFLPPITASSRSSRNNQIPDHRKVEPQHIQVPAASNGRKKILMIDDDKISVKLVRYFLEKEDYIVSVAENGAEGLRMIEQEKPDLILLDKLLPIQSGVQVLAQLKRKPDTAGIPVFILSALSQESDILSGLENGAADYITKPFSPQILVAKVKHFLN